MQTSRNDCHVGPGETRGQADHPGYKSAAINYSTSWKFWKRRSITCTAFRKLQDGLLRRAGVHQAVIRARRPKSAFSLTTTLRRSIMRPARNTRPNWRTSSPSRCFRRERSISTRNSCPAEIRRRLHLHPDAAFRYHYRFKAPTASNTIRCFWEPGRPPTLISSKWARV